MSICYLLDGVTPPARQNGKSLPCERLQAENDKLREQGERLFDKTLELATENGKLRELVADTLMDTREYCEKYGIDYKGWDSANDHIDARLRELGVEA